MGRGNTHHLVEGGVQTYRFHVNSHGRLFGAIAPQLADTVATHYESQREDKESGERAVLGAKIFFSRSSAHIPIVLLRAPPLWM